MRVDSTETEEVARAQLADSSRKLKLELDNSVRDFSLFRKTMQQMLTETFTELQSAVEKSMHGGLSRFEASIERFSETVGQVNSGFEGHSKALQESSELLVGNISQLASRIDSIKISENILTDQLKPSIRMIERSAESLGSAVDGISEKMNGIQLSDDIILKHLEPVFEKSAKSLGSAVDGISEKMNRIQLSDDIFLKRLEPAFEKITQATEISNKSAELIRRTAENELKKSNDWNENASKITSILENLENSFKKIEKASDEFAKGAEQMKEASNDIANFSSDILKIETSLSELTSRVEKDIDKSLNREAKEIGDISLAQAPAAPNISSSHMVPNGVGVEQKGIETQNDSWLKVNRFFGRKD